MDAAEDMDTLEELTEKYGIRRNQRVSTLMDAIDEESEEAGEDEEPEGESDSDYD